MRRLIRIIPVITDDAAKDGESIYGEGDSVREGENEDTTGAAESIEE